MVDVRSPQAKLPIVALPQKVAWVYVRVNIPQKVSALMILGSTMAVTLLNLPLMPSRITLAIFQFDILDFGLSILFITPNS